MRIPGLKKSARQALDNFLVSDNLVLNKKENFFQMKICLNFSIVMK
ncbi:Hydrolase [Leptospira santarosai]|nr:Hydrolase [Leptospira santarosai]